MTKREQIIALAAIDETHQGNQHAGPKYEPTEDCCCAYGAVYRTLAAVQTETPRRKIRK